MQLSSRNLARSVTGSTASAPSLRRNAYSLTLVVKTLLLGLALSSGSVLAKPFTFSYSGRLADGQNHGITGPINMELKFYTVPTGGSPIPVSPVTYTGVNLSDGIFQVDVTQLSAEEVNLVFGSANDAWVEVTDDTHSVTYPRQRMTATPYALKTPVDGNTVTYDTHGNLTVIAAGGGATPAAGGIVSLDNSSRLPPVDGSQLLNVAASSVGGQSAASVAAATTIVSNASVLPAASTLLVRDAGGGVLGTTLQGNALRLGTPGNSVSLTAPTVVGANVSYKLPAAPVSNAYLQTDGSGNLSWTTLSGGGTAGITSIGATAPLSVSMATGTAEVTLGQASGTTSGYLAASDWLTFNNALSLAGGTMTGSLNMSGQDINTTGNLFMSSGKVLALSGNTADPSGLVTTDKGKLWFNSTNNQIRYFDGTMVQTVGAAGAGITSLNGLSTSAQTFQNGTTGTSPQFSSTGSVHTLNIPMASGGGVTAGLLSNADYASFAGKVASITAGAGLAGGVITTTGTISLPNTGTASVYSKVTTDAQGRVVSGTTLSSTDLPPVPATLITGGTIALSTIPIVPASNVNGVLTAANIPSLSASTITSGTFALSTVPSLPASSINGVLSTSNIPPLAASILTSGTVNIAQIPNLAGSYVPTNGGTMTGTLTLPANGLAAGTNQLVLTGGNVGIGSVAPAQNLDVAGTIGATALAGRYTTTTTNDTLWLGTPSQTAFYIDRPNGTPYQGSNITFNYNTEVPPSYSAGFSIYNNQNDHLPLFETLSRGTSGSPGNTIAMFPTGFPMNLLSSGGGVAIGTNQAAAALDIYTGSRHVLTSAVSSGNIGLGTTNAVGLLDVRNTGGAEALLVDANGNVGIGTSSPMAPLHVMGSAIIAPGLTSPSGTPLVLSSTAGIGIGTSTPMNLLDIAGGVAMGTYAGTTAPLNGLIISGNVGIGTTATPAALSVAGHIASANAGGTAPTLTTCTSGSLSSGSNDTRGRVLYTSSAPASSGTCMLTFASIYSAAPFCVVSYNSSSSVSVPMSYTTTTSALTITFRSSGAVGDSFNYHCLQ